MIEKYEIDDLLDPDNHMEHCGVLDEDCPCHCDCGYWSEKIYGYKKMWDRERLRKGGGK